MNINNIFRSKLLIRHSVLSIHKTIGKILNNESSHICMRCLATRTLSANKGYPLLVIPALCFGLGVWQIQRRQWKLNLIKGLEDRTNVEPVPLPEDLADLSDLEYKRVKVLGTFDHEHEIYVGPKSLITSKEHSGGGLISDSSGHGFHIVTPFKLTDRDITILVNRGWVPKNKVNPETRKWAQINGEVEIVGILRQSEKRLPFQPKKLQHEEKKYLRRDIDEIASKLQTSPIFLDADKYTTLEGGPIGGQTRVTMRNEHMSYIITWFSLSGATLFIWYRKYWRQQSTRSIPEYIERMKSKKK